MTKTARVRDINRPAALTRPSHFAHPGSATAVKLGVQSYNPSYQKHATQSRSVSYFNRRRR
jgi:hypothetical protein